MEQTEKNNGNGIVTAAGIFLFLFSICIFFILTSKSDRNLEMKERQVKRVVNIDLHRPVNIHEEMNLMYDVTLDDGSVIKTRHQYQIGDSLVYFTYKIVNK
jgi:hypothetical protein